MSILVVGVSHKSATLELLERVALESSAVPKLVQSIAEAEYVFEAAVLSTCNRTEIYADVDRFHDSVEVITGHLAELSGLDAEELVSHLYVHYDDGAVGHLFQVASGLDSMVVGEAQILGQARDALRMGQDLGTVGTALNLLFQQALRVGKRVHAETDVDRAAPSVVSAALEIARDRDGFLSGQQVLVIGAGSMAALAVSTATARGARVLVANRTAEHAERLATSYGATAVPLGELAVRVAQADVVVSCTGSTGLMLTTEMLAAARAGVTAPLTVVDLALPHDVDPAVADLAGVRLITLATLAEDLRDGPAAASVDQVWQIVAEETGAFVAARRSAKVTPTLVALRSMATSVVDSEVARLRTRLPDLDEAQHAEVASTLRRVAEKLLHQPTVRVKELARTGEAALSYEEALSVLFALDPASVDAVTSPGEVL